MCILGGALNKRSVPIFIVSCLLALAGVLGYLPPSPIEANPPKLLMENPGGRVVFSHQDHSRTGGPYGATTCAACHHELNLNGPALPDVKGGMSTAGVSAVATAVVAPASPVPLPKVAPCKSCHGSVDAPDYVSAHQKTYQAMGGNASCVSCHHTRLTGLADNWKHQEHWEYAGDCSTCHHAEYTTRSGSKRTVKPQSCANCHTAKGNPLTGLSLRDAAHAKCQPCHADPFDAKIKGCDTCHARTSPAKDLAAGAPLSPMTACSTCHAPMPNPMDAYHAKCRTCHDKTGKGPGVKAPCAQCHTP